MRFPRPTGAQLSILSAAALIFLWCEDKPLAMNDLGIYLAQGREMGVQGGFADVDRFTHTVAGARFLNGTWLAQYCFFRGWQLGGFALLQFVLACTSCGTLLITVVGARRASGRVPVAAGAGLLAFWLVLGNLGLRPQLFSLPLFAIYALLAMTVPPTWKTMLASAAIVAAWANLHGAFAIAPVLSVLVGVGLVWESIPVAAKPAEYVTRALDAIRTDSAARRHVFTAAIALAAACANPYGWRILGYVAQNSSMPASRGLTEWQHTRLTTFHGVRLFSSVAILAFTAWRVRRLPARRDLPALLAFGVLGFSAIRHVVWTGMIWPLALARMLPARENDPEKRYPAWLGIAAVVFWGFLLVNDSPFVRVRGLEGDADLAKRFDADTPIALAAWCEGNSVGGNLYNTMEWGSFFAWRLPDTKLFVDIRIWIFPDDLWRQYLDVANAEPGWDDVLDRHEVRFAILERKFDARLLLAIAASPRWEQIYADDLGLVYRRKALPAP